MLAKKLNDMYDVLVIGGGINGTGVAADAAGRGLSVLLCEKNDLASGTSSTSSKLIHGGLRYLEQYDFKLVRESLKEREILLEQAPHLVHPIQFILPHHPNLRSAWLIRMGLFCYDILSGRTKLPRSKALNLGTNLNEDPLNLSLKKGFSYYDCKVNDARLVVTNAIRAKEKGATILTRTCVINAQRSNNRWQVKLRDIITNETFTVFSKTLINASGPWIDSVNDSVLKTNSSYRVKLVQGSHIVVPQLYKGHQGYLLQNKDGRIIFVIPYHSQFTMIGTTDEPFSGNPKDAHISANEIKYLLDSVNNYFHHPIKSSQIISHWSGVRALLDSSHGGLSSLSREYKIECIEQGHNAPLINIFGGKITTYRALAEKVLNQLSTYFPKLGSSWTSSTALPGGDLGMTFEQFDHQLAHEFPYLPPLVRKRYANHYGTRCYLFLKGTQSLSDLGQAFSPHLYEAEVNYLVKEEWARTVDDIVERRTQLGLVLAESQKRALHLWLTKHNVS